MTPLDTTLRVSTPSLMACLLGTLLISAACSSSPEAERPGLSPPADSGAASRDAGDAADVVAPGPDAGTAPASTRKVFLFSSLHLQPATIGADLDGDGSIDNMLTPRMDDMWALVRDLNLSSFESFDLALQWLLVSCAWSLIIDVDGIDSAVQDDQVRVRLYAGQDTEQPPQCANNFTAPARFDISPTWRSPDNGEPVLQLDGEIRSGELHIRVPGLHPFFVYPQDQEVSVSFYELQISATFNQSGSLDATATAGISAEGVKAILPFFLPDSWLEPARIVMDTWADLDSDGDGEADAISTALRFHAIPAQIP